MTALGLPAFLINDARAFGLAELRLGAGRGASSMIGFTLGTGVGGVIAVDGRVYQGHDGTAGELGHQTIEPDGPWCGCGNRGCLEAFARADQIAAACGTATAEEAIERARAGDPRALDGLAQVGRYLGIGIASMITVDHAGPRRDRRRDRGGGGPAARPDPGRAARGASGRPRSTRSRSSSPSSGRGPARSARRSTARSPPRDATRASLPHAGRGRPMIESGYQPHYRQIELALRERIAALPTGRAAAVRCGAVRGVRGQPDDRAERHAAARRGRAGPAGARAAAASSPSRPRIDGPTG